MFLSTELFEAIDDSDREDLALETAEPPLALPRHLELLRADSDGADLLDVTDLDPPTPLLPYVAS